MRFYGLCFCNGNLGSFHPVKNFSGAFFWEIVEVENVLRSFGANQKKCPENCYWEQWKFRIPF